MPRESFDSQLESLQNAIVQMGAMVDSQLRRSITALETRDLAEARSVIADDVLINRAQHEIEEHCIVLLATQQPMAGDLRVIFAILNIAVELERIGDYAEGIGKIALRYIEQPELKPLLDIPRMAVKARTLIEDSLLSFVRRDTTWARSVAAGDDEVDALTDQIYRELLTYMLDDPKNIERATLLMWVSHNLERAADRATNISERVLQLITGKIEELNP